MNIVARTYNEFCNIEDALIKEGFSFCDITDYEMIYRKTVCGVVTEKRIKPLFWKIYRLRKDY